MTSLWRAADCSVARLRRGRAEVRGPPAHRALLADRAGDARPRRRLCSRATRGVVARLALNTPGRIRSAAAITPASASRPGSSAGVADAREAAVVALAARGALGTIGGVLGAAARAHPRRRAAGAREKISRTSSMALCADPLPYNRTMCEWLIRILATPNLLGTLSLAVAGRIETRDRVAACGPSAPAALSALDGFLGGEPIDAPARDARPDPLRAPCGWSTGWRRPAWPSAGRGPDARSVAVELTPVGHAAAEAVRTAREAALEQALCRAVSRTSARRSAGCTSEMLAGLTSDRARRGGSAGCATSTPAATTGAPARLPRLGALRLEPPEDRRRPLALAVGLAQLRDRGGGVVLDAPELELARVGSISA